MSVAVEKTKAEQSFVDGLSKIEAQLPGTEAVQAARAAAVRRFEELGLPNRRIEAWKYTDLRSAVKEAPTFKVGEQLPIKSADLTAALGPLAKVASHRIVFVNGAYCEELSTAGELGGVDFESLAVALRRGDEAVSEFPQSKDDAVMALNTAYMTDGANVRIAAEAVIEKPLLLVYVRAGSEPIFTAVRNSIDIGGNASVRIVEAFVDLPGAGGGGQVNAATNVIAGDEANVIHVKITSGLDGGATHLSNTFVRLGRKTTFTGFQQTQGVGLARNQILVTFDGEHAKLDLSGVLLGRSRDHIDTTLVVDHAVPACESREHFKAVLDDNARGVFQGKIIVQPVAQKTDGKQMSQGLLLSPGAEFDSKPELEIYADDVACGHGATCAELDRDLMFYCRSRGIPEPEARLLLIESFIGEVVEKIDDASLCEAMMEFTRGWLST